MNHLLSNRVLLRVIVWGCITAAAVIVAEVWFDIVSDVVFSKILITCAVVVVLAGLLKAVAADIDEDKDKGFFN